MKQPYGEKFFARQKQRSLPSAQEIVRVLLDLLRPTSVIDVGCGVGTWLSVFCTHGVKDIYGVDGSYVNKQHLLIPPERFVEADLRHPFSFNRQFDLVLALEIAEHLPPESADAFVSSLTQLGQVIYFSAAVPYQGGTSHLNEQWQDFWAQRFQQKGYLPIDYIRKAVWQNDKISFWYAQGGLLYVERHYLEAHHDLKKKYEETNLSQLSIVHPKMITTMGATAMIKRLPDAVGAAVRKRVRVKA
ncbi:MAG: methyltransferase domain-containing protein [Anaerolineae bacterium]|nr:methyltransferase domain-containing protein [Anaerolineae bacterium]